MGAREAGDDRAVHLARDRAHGLEVARRGDREARLDDVDAQAAELVRDLQLLGRVQRDARRLLTVAQRGVEDDDPVVVHVAVLLLGLWDLLLRAGFAASRPPRAIPPEGGGEGGGAAGATCAAKGTSTVLRYPFVPMP